MKNIHILPTKEPSRFYNTNKGEWFYRSLEIGYVPNTIQTCYNHNIYITSDEEIKEGWYINIFTNYIVKGSGADTTFKHIILTTDKDLIKDGVQAIPDEFLEWFIKNPSCEEVEIGNQSIKSFETGHFEDFYKIIIPKEEYKQIDENGKLLSYWGGLAEPKWQQERMYSAEETKNLLYRFLEHIGDIQGKTILNVYPKEWFEQFKKK